ncbi:hypothetical protein pEaSNUABM10_00113 [Erwinia phage pEa_SNUABM_10]|nr:hypothetical protein pEaSNUABM43_00110 [Erwinia phage pEa_SNUABM_43]QVW55427.1 hypothetical protein pEaSNUABM42_00110 [Erwinia phage pEa_SNUABM_42]QVW55976.1 hypothetical protein pEaSNUABM10_00113 [Erwinia phage pEa_SNUABM_10]
MFYRELQQYTDALQRSELKHDSNFDDVTDVLSQFEDLVVVVKTDPIGDQSRSLELILRNPHGRFHLRFRYSKDFLLTLLCHVETNGQRHKVRWWDDYSKFEYAEAEHRQTVYDFMRAVINGF